MRRVAEASEPPVVIPVVVVPVDVHVPLVIPVVEGSSVQNTIHATTPRSIACLEAEELFSGLYRIRHLKCQSILYQVSSFFEVSTYITLFQILPTGRQA